MDAQAEADRRVAQLLASDTVQGEAKKKIREASDYKTQADKEVEAEAFAYQKLLPDYKKNPRLVRERLWEDARQTILGASGVETIYLPSDPTKTIYLEINRDPRIQKSRREQKLKEENAQRLETDPR